MGIEKLMAHQSKANKEIIESMHLHDSEITTLENTMNSLINDTRHLVSHIHKSFALASINSKLMNAFMAASFTINVKEAAMKAFMSLLLIEARAKDL